MGDIRKLQKEVYKNKVKKGFNITDVNLEFNYTYGELAEAFDAYKKKMPSLGEELADVVIYLMGLSEMLSIDLEKEVIEKIKKNKVRKYKKVNGTNIKFKNK
jgi:NTP pyrophosphatase (non-canonical NTP hydrolase)